MKKLFITIFALTMLNSICFAAETTSTAIQTALAISPKTIQGKVASVSAVSTADVMKGLKSGIVIVDNTGNKLSFIVRPTTTIYDANFQPLTLDKITMNDKVTLMYSVDKAGLNEVQSISLMK